MAYLEYISDVKIESLVKNVLDTVLLKKREVKRDFQKNVIDPFSTIFDASLSKLDHDSWKNAEMIRQCQKTLTNHIGNLHQKILGELNGWEDLGVGGVVDLVCKERKIIAEVKNKHNTVTGGKLADQYQSLERLVTPKASQYKDYTAYFVNVIPKRPERFDKTFEPSDKDKGIRCAKNEKIRIIDGASFYTLATGRPKALEELYLALPSIIENIFRNSYQELDFSLRDKNVFQKYFYAAFK